MTRRDRFGLYARRVRSQSLARTVRELLDPVKVARHVRRLVSGEVPRSNPYLPSVSRGAEAQFAASLLGVDEASVQRAFGELEADSEFVTELRQRYETVRAGATLHVGRFEILYALVRLVAPATIVETGAHDGLSSAVMLRALGRNRSGTLISIDLPSTDLPSSVGGPGWLVPAELRDRWELRLGDARDLLPAVVTANVSIDLFFHDSDHSPKHQEFEFRTVRSHLGRSGVMVSDQDYPFDPLLDRLAAEWGFDHHRVRTTAGEPGNFMGGLARRREPQSSAMTR